MIVVQIGVGEDGTFVALVAVHDLNALIKGALKEKLACASWDECAVYDLCRSCLCSAP